MAVTLGTDREHIIGSCVNALGYSNFKMDQSTRRLTDGGHGKTEPTGFLPNLIMDEMESYVVLISSLSCMEKNVSFLHVHS